MNEFERITQNPAVMGGKPCIRGMRVTVGAIVSQIGAGRCIEEVLADSDSPDRSAPPRQGDGGTPGPRSTQNAT